MSVAVSFVFTQCQRHFSDMGQSIFLDLLNEFDNELEPDLRLYPQITQNVSFISGQREYTLDSTLSRIFEVGVYTGSTSYVKLKGTSIDELDYLFTGWRGDTIQGTPTMWYSFGGMIGFYPTPNVSTTGGYPIAQLSGIQVQAAYTITSNLPAEPLTCKAWTYGVCLAFAIMYHDDQVPKFMKLAADAKENLRRYIYGRNLRTKPKVQAKIPRVRFI